MSDRQKLRIYMITGEESGDALGASILSSLNARGISYDLGGLAGPRMQEMGAKSLFDTSELSIMGFTAVIARLPKLIRLVNQVVKDVISFNPDVLLLVDSPDFNYAVAKRVRKKNPNIPIVKYVCPSVWAWRQGRAKTMGTYIDHVLAILPFEPELMEKLGGPQTTYVGHPLANDLERFGNQDKSQTAQPVRLLLLPGSRTGEIKRVMPIIQNTVEALQERDFSFSMKMPVVDKQFELVSDLTSDWRIKPEIISGEDQKHEAFKQADVALACSGTVLLELALYSVPMISIYKLDPIGSMARRLVVSWSVCLPNLITDQPLVQERIEEYARPQLLAREVEQLSKAGHTREAQLQGFRDLREIMKKDADNGELVTSKILEIAGKT